LLSGSRGSGKSTELRRLAHLLRDSGFATVVVDVQDYLDTTQPVDPTTFLHLAS
jgi:tRNA uridine 5-carbamoylmethylation protein Kti12